MAGGVGLEQVLGATADLVDVIDLPGGVVQEGDRSALHEQVVVVGRAAEEGGDAGDLVADLEPDAVGEELPGGVGVGRAEDDVTELAGRDRCRALERRTPGVGPLDVARRVHRCHRLRHRGDRGADLDDHANVGHRLDRDQPIHLPGRLDPARGEVRSRPIEVVSVISADHQLDDLLVGAWTRRSCSPPSEVANRASPRPVRPKSV